MAGYSNQKVFILYEDEHLLVVKKPFGMESQRGKNFAMDLESLLRGYLSSKTKSDRPYLAVIHRLDRPVAGVMVYAKTKKAAADLSSQLQKESFSKVYEAVVSGTPSGCEGRLEDYLVADKRTGMASVSDSSNPDAKKAVLTWKEIPAQKVKSIDLMMPYLNSPSPAGGWHCLRIVLETGRHHQIRTQLSHAGMPIAGDMRYGGIQANGPRGAIALCAAQLSFRHPATGKYLTFSWNDDTNITAVAGR